MIQADLEDFKTGWFDLTLGIKLDEIDKDIWGQSKTHTLFAVHVSRVFTLTLTDPKY